MTPNHPPGMLPPRPPRRADPDGMHVVQFSGGIGSFTAALRVAEQHGTGNLVLLMADTRAEDEDLWRFAHEAAELIGVAPTIVRDGRTPWEVFADVRFLGNSRVAPCSYHLKQKPCRAWLEENTDPANTLLYLGIDASEIRRTPAIIRGWRPWTVRFPLIETEPMPSKEEMLANCRDMGIEPPRLYRLGFSHNNCHGSCIRAGQRQWAHLHNVFPERFTAAETAEAHLRAELGDVAILRDRRGGRSRPLPLSELRQRLATRPAATRIPATGTTAEDPPRAPAKHP